MKKFSTILAVVTGLALANLSTVRADTPAPATAPNPPHKEHHPAIHAAIRALEKARAELQAASHDFGGHRADALVECDKAIAQLRIALQYDKN